MIKGRVKWFDTTKGYGFIVTDQNDGDILLHANVLRNFGRSSVAEGSGITVEVQATDRGRQAVVILDIEAPDAEVEEAASEAARPTDYLQQTETDSPLLPARVKWFDKAKGFGFVNVFADNADIFVHMEVLRVYGLADLQPGEAVGVRIVSGPRGQMASEVRNWDYATTVESEVPEV